MNRHSFSQRSAIRVASVLLEGVLLCGIATLMPEVQATPYPERPIKLIAATTPGSLPDVLARLLAERLAPSLGQAIVVENRPGGGGTIGLGAVAKAAPDGYTLGIINTPALAAANMITRMPYDTENDLSPVALIGWNYALLVIRSDLPVRSVPELVAAAKTQPGMWKYSSPGNGTPGHLGMKLFERQTGTELLHVPYKGAPAATMALLRGDVDVYMAGMLTLEPHVKSGTVRALAVIAPRRLAANPDVPTMIELGYPQVDLTDWQGVVAPAGTPVEVIERLGREIANIVAQPDMKARMEHFSMEPSGMGPREFKTLIHSEMPRLRQLVREANIRME
jgi:tripartite-type tricarboxylate transporter receptor subunit TctC